jgi:hypothetical protein
MVELEIAAEAPIPTGGAAIEGRSLGRIALTRLRHDRVAMVGGVVASSF